MAAGYPEPRESDTAKDLGDVSELHHVIASRTGAAQNDATGGGLHDEPACCGCELVTGDRLEGQWFI
jgi:hypothetical protein